eukprot:g15894.t1
MTMVESHGYRGVRGGGAESSVSSDVGAGKDNNNRERAILVRPRTRKLEQSSSMSQEQYEVIADHVDQVEYEFVAKLSISCALLACLVVWFAWSFWWDKNMRRSLTSRRRRGQRMPPVERTSSQPPPPPRGDTSPSSQGTGLGSGYQRDARAVGRIAQHQQNQRQKQSNGLGTPLKEFFNPMWGRTTNARGDRHAGFREWSALPDRSAEPGGSSRNAAVAPRGMRPPPQQRRWRAPR